MNSDGLKFVLQESGQRPLPTSRTRDVVLATDTNKVLGLTGVRRCGKTFLFFDTIHRLLARGVNRHQIIYLNFEDDRLQPVAAAELDLVLRCQRELFEPARTGRLYLFLDEVQSAPGWERWVRRLHDTEDISIFVTGSSSDLLTRELSSALRGRSVTLEVLPLSFREYLAFRGIELQQHDAHSESVARAALEQYLQWGGFPEVVLATPAMRPLILEEYASLMFWRDLVERHSIRNEPVMRSLLRHCFRNTASLVNLSKLHRDLQSQGLDIGRNTLFEYFAILQDSGLVFLLPIHDGSVRRQARNPRKLHVIDPGLVAAFKARSELDVGHKLETAVFLQGRRRWREWHYWLGEAEVDLCDAEGRTFVNSCWNLGTQETIEREIRAMAAGRQLLPLAEGVLVYHEELHGAGRQIPGACPAWKWLLEQSVRGAQ